MKTARLIYVADPMCSWCWGFAPHLAALRRRYEPRLGFLSLMGGLAPDSDEPMPEETRAYVQSAWRAVAERTGAAFNWEFWERCAPRRSTWPACRAVIAAGELQAEGRDRMFEAIQSAYYEQARNPSDQSTLIELASEQLGVDAARAFGALLDDAGLEARFEKERAAARTLGARSFPTLLVEAGDRVATVVSGYDTAEAIATRIDAALAAAGA